MSLAVEHVAKSFATRAEPLVVLRDVSLSLARGENAAIVGPSGSGKSTLLAIVGGLVAPSSGRVLLDGDDPARLDEPALAAYRNHRIGFVFQDHHLLPQLTAVENVLLPAIAAGPASAEAAARAEELLVRVGLGRRRRSLPGELSGGERQRVAVARALLNRPAVVLADEPTGNLDRSAADAVGELLLELPRHEGTMVLVVTHSERLAARCARRMELVDGRIEPLG